MLRPLTTLLALAALAMPSGAAECRSPLALAERALAGGDWGTLPAESRYTLDEDRLAEENRLFATVQLRAEIRGPSRFCISILVDVEGELLPLESFETETVDTGEGGLWTFTTELELPATAEQILVIAENTQSGAWAAAPTSGAEDPLVEAGAGAVRLAGPPAAWHELEGTSPTAGAASKASEVVVRIVPPRRQPATGSTRIETLVTSNAVDRVVFYLDGREVDADGRRPFVGRVELDSPPRVQKLRTVAYDGGGHEMGEDRVLLNELDAPFRARLVEVVGDVAAGAVEVRAEVSVPAGAELDRVELYLNQERVAAWDGPPYRARVELGEVSYSDFLRLAAFLEDGSSIDDVVLLAAPAEEVDVNLVEVFAVVNDGEGRPVSDLEAGDFTLVHRGEARPVERFAYADDVPLLLGVVIDTSGSMRFLMEDTRRAAARFLSDTLLPGDRGFVVDFDDKPRLLSPTTGEITELFLSLQRLEAEGKTALYDAVVFSMLQFEREPGRKALVVLTDGDDRDSRFGPRACVDYGTKLGVPIYVIGLGNLDFLARSYPKGELRRITGNTGGEFFLVESLDELGAAYAQIAAELRNQYALAFYADTDLSDEERRQLEVRLRREGLEARVVVGAETLP